MTQFPTVPVWRPRLAAESSWLGAVVTTRHGGSSVAPYDSLNLGLSTGDDIVTVGANRDRLQKSLGLAATRITTLSQVHGTRIWRIPDPAAREGDGLWTESPDVPLAIGVADCVPAFVWDVRLRRLALVHAGWRGTAAGIVSAAIDIFLAAGSRAAELRLALGPCIGPCCYTVGADVASQFPAAAVRQHAATPRLDLRLVNRMQAQARGLAPEHIDADPPCTGCETATFFSHRVQGPRTGRMWALAWRRGDFD